MPTSLVAELASSSTVAGHVDVELFFYSIKYKIKKPIKSNLDSIDSHPKRHSVKVWKVVLIFGTDCESHGQGRPGH